MLSVHLQKDVTLMKDLSAGRSQIWSIKYNQLSTALQDENEITVNYCYGQRKRRNKQLQELGYKLKNTIWYNTEELYSSIKEVWTR
jgi:hypothetical protein